MTATRPPRLLIWRDVLCEYTCGMIVALAPDQQAAVDTARSDETAGEDITAAMSKVAPEIVELGDAPNLTPRIWFVHGSG